MRPALPTVAAALALLLVGCRDAPAGGAGVPAAEPDTALVATLGTLHLLEARQARFGDVPPSLRTDALQRHGFTEASLRRAVARAQREVRTWEELSIAVDAWMSNPALGGVPPDTDALAPNLGAPSLPPELQR